VVSSEGEAELNNLKCYIHQATGVRFFWDEQSKFLIWWRFQWLSKYTNNLVYFFSANCYHSSKLVKERYESRKNYLKNRTKAEDIQLSVAVEGVITFLDGLNAVIEGVGLPEFPIRSAWMNWNFADPHTYGVKSPEMVKYCVGQVQAALASDGVEDIDRIKEYQLKLSELHLMLIMITSQQTKDELQYEQYLRISRQSQCYTISLTIEVCSFLSTGLIYSIH
jgi:hypothetical protein